MEQQNNKNQQVATENPVKDDDFLLTQEEVEYFKSVPTNLHVVYSKVYNRVLTEKTDTVFTNEDEATTFAETLATTISGLPLDFWSASVGDIAAYYSLTDPDNPNTMFRITIYPKKI